MNTQNTSPKIVQILNIVALIGVLVVNGLSNALPLNGRTAGEISDSLPSFFTPAGYTFSIWGLIYMALIGYIIYQALPSQQNRPWQQQIGYLFILSSIANSAWIFAWHYGYYSLSVLLMVGLLATLIAIYVRLNIGRADESLTLADRLLVHGPFSLYLGWITVATIANIASVLAYLGWNGFGIDGEIWSAVMMSVAVIVAGILLINRRNLAYAGVLVWALFGIRAAYPETTVIATTAVVAAILIALLAIAGYIRTRDPAGPALNAQTA